MFYSLTTLKQKKRTFGFSKDLSQAHFSGYQNWMQKEHSSYKLHPELFA